MIKNNGDKPAVPIKNADMTSDFYGLDKREMMAMHAMNGILSNEYLMKSFLDIAKRSGDDIDEVVSVASINHANSLLAKLEEYKEMEK